MNNIIWKKRAMSKNNGDFISIESYSGHINPNMADPSAPEYLLEVDSSDEIIGKNIIEALKNSRPLSLEEHRNTAKNLAESYKTWIQKMMEKYGYKTKRALFKSMKSCSILYQDDFLTIKPSKHVTLEGWSGDGFNEEDYVKIPEESSFSEIGAALRLAFTRCR
ncbi:MAG TPA: contact-dependent growth inhibition system immunity protein [Alphaproteobacteria bacterium]|nr:contact-dependent growth inhibition system immunity protein [Alphaproteobacteria bacterium]HQS94337.1 contact-dependent growth inhibition system immunity protein [Alphaproteobacteria bacterium]